MESIWNYKQISVDFRLKRKYTNFDLYSTIIDEKLNFKSSRLGKGSLAKRQQEELN